MDNPGDTKDIFMIITFILMILFNLLALFYAIKNKNIGMMYALLGYIVATIGWINALYRLW